MLKRQTLEAQVISELISELALVRYMFACSSTGNTIVSSGRASRLRSHGNWDIAKKRSEARFFSQREKYRIARIRVWQNFCQLTKVSVRW
jgi:hypothetical protein